MAYYKTAAFTPSLSRLALNTLKDILDSNDNVHLVFSRAHPWTPEETYEITPNYDFTYKNNTRSVMILPPDEQEFQNNAIVSLKALHIDVTAPIQTSFTGGASLNYWDQYSQGRQQTLQMDTSTRRVYICVKNGADSTGTVIPTGSIAPTNAFTTTLERTNTGVDSLREFWWKYLFTMDSDAYLRRVPIANIGGLFKYPITFDPTVRANAVKGQIVGYKIIDPGQNITTIPTITVRGDGTGASAKAFIYRGKLVAVIPTNINSLGSNYTRASVTVSGSSSGREPIVVPVISQGPGLGYDPAVEGLADTFVFRFDPGTNSDFMDSMEYRSIGLVTNLKKYKKFGSSPDSDFTDSTGRAYTAIKMTTRNFANRGDVVARTTFPFTQGYVIGKDSANSYSIFVYQNPDPFSEYSITQGDQTYALNYGEDSWGTSGTLINLNTTATGTINSITSPSFNKNSGEVVYLLASDVQEMTTKSPTVALSLRI